MNRWRIGGLGAVVVGAAGLARARSAPATPFAAPGPYDLRFIDTMVLHH